MKMHNLIHIVLVLATTRINNYHGIVQAQEVTSSNMFRNGTGSKNDKDNAAASPPLMQGGALPPKADDTKSDGPSTNVNSNGKNDSGGEQVDVAAKGAGDSPVDRLPVAGGMPEVSHPDNVEISISPDVLTLEEAPDSDFAITVHTTVESMMCGFSGNDTINCYEKCAQSMNALVGCFVKDQPEFLRDCAECVGSKFAELVKTHGRRQQESNPELPSLFSDSEGVPNLNDFAQLFQNDQTPGVKELVQLIQDGETPSAEDIAKLFPGRVIPENIWDFADLLGLPDSSSSSFAENMCPSASECVPVCRNCYEAIRITAQCTLGCNVAYSPVASRPDGVKSDGNGEPDDGVATSNGEKEDHDEHGENKQPPLPVDGGADTAENVFDKGGSDAANCTLGCDLDSLGAFQDYSTYANYTKTSFSENLAVILLGVTKLLDDEEITLYVKVAKRFLNQNDPTVFVVFVRQQLVQENRRLEAGQSGSSLEVTTEVTSNMDESPGTSAVEAISQNVASFMQTLKEEDETKVFASVEDAVPKRKEPSAPTAANTSAANETKCADGSECARRCEQDISGLEHCFERNPVNETSKLDACMSCLLPDSFTSMLDSQKIPPAEFVEAVCSTGYTCEDICGTCFKNAAAFSSCAWGCDVTSPGGAINSDGSEVEGRNCEDAVRVAQECFASHVPNQTDAFTICESCYLTQKIVTQYEGGSITKIEFAGAVCANGPGCASLCGPCFDEMSVLSSCSWGCIPDSLFEEVHDPPPSSEGSSGDNSTDGVNGNGRECSEVIKVAKECFANATRHENYTFDGCASCYSSEELKMQLETGNISKLEYARSVCSNEPGCESSCGYCFLEMHAFASCSWGCEPLPDERPEPGLRPLSQGASEAICDDGSECASKCEGELHGLEQCFDAQTDKAGKLSACLSCLRPEDITIILVAAVIPPQEFIEAVCSSGYTCEKPCGACFGKANDVAKCAWGCELDSPEQLPPSPGGETSGDLNTTVLQGDDDASETMCDEGTKCAERCQGPLIAIAQCMTNQPDEFFRACSSCLKVEELSSRLVSGELSEEGYIDEACMLRSSCASVCAECFGPVKEFDKCAWACEFDVPTSLNSTTSNNTLNNYTNSSSGSSFEFDVPTSLNSTNSSAALNNYTNSSSGSSFAEKIAVVLWGISRLLDKREQESYARAMQKFLRKEDPTAVVKILRQQLVQNSSRLKRNLQSSAIEVTTEVVSQQDENPGAAAIDVISTDSVAFKETLREEETEVFSLVHDLTAELASPPPAVNETATNETKCADGSECATRCEGLIAGLEKCFAEQPEGDFDICFNCLRPEALVSMLDLNEILARDFVHQVCSDVHKCETVCGECLGEAKYVGECAWSCEFKPTPSTTEGATDGDDNNGDGKGSKGSSTEDDAGNDTIFFTASVLLAVSVVAALYFSIQVWRMAKTSIDDKSDQISYYQEEEIPDDNNGYDDETVSDDVRDQTSASYDSNSGQAKASEEYYDETVGDYNDRGRDREANYCNGSIL